MAKKAWVSAHTLLAEALAANGGSLTALQETTVTRAGFPAAWDMSATWKGAPLAGVRIRRSLWNRTHTLHLFTAAAGMPEFTVRLPTQVSDEEAMQLAEVYMMTLNMRRKEG